MAECPILTWKGLVTVIEEAPVRRVVRAVGEKVKEYRALQAMGRLVRVGQIPVRGDNSLEDEPEAIVWGNLKVCVQKVCQVRGGVVGGLGGWRGDFRGRR
jgi:hypothetical protein